MDRLPKRIAYLYLLLGLVVSASVSWYLFRVENDRIHQNFRSDLELYCTAIERIMVQHFETVEGVAATLSFFRQPDPEAFKFIANSTRLRQPAIAAVSWFWYLPGDERHELEHKLTQYYGTFAVQQAIEQSPDSSGKHPQHNRAPPGDHYLVLVAAQPENNIDSASAL